ncbi:JmjC domain-containing histone demethylation protein 1, partial [Coemansia sp. RSA 1933]
RILNVISLEISDTKLGQQIQRPRVVDELDLVEKYWPKSKRKPNRYPLVKAYCLMGVANAYTDFHIDFSATWVYYHVISGEKIFYLVPPTPSNMRKFESWSKSPEQSVSLFAESVKQCFEVHVKVGNTLFIPAGWIHAVFTPVDTIVIGGNFLVMQSLNTHIGIYKLESRTKVPSRYRFPFFLKLCRYMAELLARKWIKMDSNAKSKWTLDGLEGAFVLAAFLDDKLSSDDYDSETAQMLGDKQALKKHVATLLELVGAELGSRMTPEEWVNRDPQLREGCHFRWMRPGVPQYGSLLLATRPRRNRAAGSGETTELSMTKIRKRRETRKRSEKSSRPKLVRGRRSNNTTGSNGEGDCPDERNSDGEDMLAALGTGNGGSSLRRGKRPGNKIASDSNDDSDAESSEGSSGSEGGSESNGSSESSYSSSDGDDDNHTISDSKGGKRHVSETKGSSSASSLRSQSLVFAESVGRKPLSAKMHIAKRFKIKF